MASRGGASIAAHLRKSSAWADDTPSHSSISRMHKRSSSEVFDEGRRSSSCFGEPLVVPLASAESRAGSVLRCPGQRPRPVFTEIVTYSNVRRVHQALRHRSPVEFEAEHSSSILVIGLPTVRSDWPSALGRWANLLVVRGLLNKWRFSGILNDHVAISIPS